MMAMARTQITLEPYLHRRARERAAQLGLSLAEYVRRLVAADLMDESPGKVGVADLFDLGDSGGSDVATYKDRYLGEAVEARHPRKRPR
jgi:hypothetical protein